MKKRTLALILCGVIITALLPSFHTAIAAEGEAVIATDKINVRGDSGLSYGIKAEVKKGKDTRSLKKRETGCSFS